MNDFPELVPLTRDIRETKKEDKKVKPTLWDKMWNKTKINKDSRKVAAIFLRDNGKAEAMELESKKGFFTVEGKPYHEHRDCMWRLGKEGIPLVIIPENNLFPLGTPRYYYKRPEEETIQYFQRKFAECQDHVLRGIRHAEFVRLGEKEGNKINMKAVIIWVIVGIIGYAVVKGGGLV